MIKTIDHISLWSTLRQVIYYSWWLHVPTELTCYKCYEVVNVVYSVEMPITSLMYLELFY